METSFWALASTVLLGHLLAVMSPGADFFIVLRQTLSNGQRAGLMSAAGVAVGVLLHVAYCLAGIALVISQSIVLFQVIKWLGALYLIYLGYQVYTGDPTPLTTTPETPAEGSLWGAFWSGVLTNALNPKVTLFFLGLFTLVISPETPLGVQVGLGLMMAVDTFLWFALVVGLFSRSRVREGFGRWQGVVNKLFGGVLAGLGVKVGLDQV